LAGRLSLAELTESSRSEQTGAGLDRCTLEELGEFQELNAAYIEKFGFPFIFAVKGYHRTDILEAFRVRVNHSREEEFKTAIEQVHRIARLRLETIADEC
jgi:OHCU decarboxylase